MNTQLPPLSQAKAQAKRLRAELADQGTEISHAQSLELVAHQNGFRDWNAFHAAIGNRPPPAWTPGGRVEGSYLSQPFKATVVSVTMLRPGWFRLALELDEPVDVVTFDSFSNYRKRVHCVIGPLGMTQEKTSDGTPHVILEC
ncbi:hypothetical protein SAMN06265173_102180 [Thalassovita litoralis]|jgi:hypothetical protein|uniref:Glyoxalase-related protein domain-containing protein n=1 Tax=Thalassovita litoralis TaxID=1010611 RepID=A0A521B7A3_9RHOB|nr:glyoxalase superfamily protein [Thalassovita litoralis]SMO42946.1 hypothetical protein SAMN06265173_102180 [Thalassovita litoralis]